jgi:ribonuclease T
MSLSSRFRGFLPVVIDLETGGFEAKTDAILEMALVTLKMNDDGNLVADESHDYHIKPFAGARLDPKALEFTGIDVASPDRNAIREVDAFKEAFEVIRKAVKANNCNRAIIVAHNAHFDLGFINAAIERSNLKRSPLHPFSCMDTATLSGLAYGHTVLAKSCKIAGIEFDGNKAHSALYDTQKTAELFCSIVNRWKNLGGWPLATPPDLD